MPDTEKKWYQKVIDGAASVYNFLDGKKRRIALIGAFTAKVFKPYTVASIVGEYAFYFFGGADLVANADKLKSLPSGLSKKNSQ